MRLVGLALADELLHEPAVEGVDVDLGEQIHFQDVEADLRCVADAVAIGADEGLYREVCDQLVAARDAGQVDRGGRALRRIDRLPDLGLCGAADKGLEDRRVVFEHGAEGQFDFVAAHCAGQFDDQRVVRDAHRCWRDLGRVDFEHQCGGIDRGGGVQQDAVEAGIARTQDGRDAEGKLLRHARLGSARLDLAVDPGEEGIGEFDLQRTDRRRGRRSVGAENELDLHEAARARGKETFTR